MDLWASVRIGLGWERVGLLVTEGDMEKAKITMEDTVSLLEKLSSLPDRTELRCQSPVMQEYSLTLCHCWSRTLYPPSDIQTRTLACHTDMPPMWYITQDIEFFTKDVPHGVFRDIRTVRQEEWFQECLRRIERCFPTRRWEEE